MAAAEQAVGGALDGLDAAVEARRHNATAAAAASWRSSRRPRSLAGAGRTELVNVAAAGSRRHSSVSSVGGGGGGGGGGSRCPLWPVGVGTDAAGGTRCTCGGRR